MAGILEECGQVGVKAAVIISSGFSEMGNQAGEAEIKAIAARHGIRIVGPNCAGIINTSHHLCPTMETLPPPGPVALISQSGALAGVVLGWAARDGLGISKFVSYGNRADVNEIDLLDYLADDDETRVVGVYIETVSDGRGFMAAAAKCAARKPVIVIKAGRGRIGPARHSVPHRLARRQRRGLRRRAAPVRRDPGRVRRGDCSTSAAGSSASRRDPRPPRRHRHQLRRAEHPGRRPRRGRGAGRGRARPGDPGEAGVVPPAARRAQEPD